MALLDASGLLYEEVQVEQAGVDWAAYREAGIIGYAVALVSTVFLTVLVKLVFVKGASRLVALSEAKTLVAGFIGENPGFYRHAPPDELIARVNRASTFHQLISSIYKD
jgi:hypothetical protein